MVDGSKVIVNVLYGTVTGNAEEIARRIFAELPDRNFSQGVLRCLSDYQQVSSFNLPESYPKAYNVIVVSTTGDGDPPETIRPFMRLLRKKDPALLKGLQYTVLGLGDTNYENFCQTGKKVDVSMAKLGAVSFLKRGEADDGVGLEIVVEPWLKRLWNTLETISLSRDSDLAQEPVATTQSSPDAAAAQEKPAQEKVSDISGIVQSVTVKELGFEEQKLPKIFPPKLAAYLIDTVPADYDIPCSVHPSYRPDIVRSSNVTAARKLTSDDADSTVWHMELTCDEQSAFGKTYRAGDAFGVLVENDAQEVTRFLTAIHAEHDSLLHVIKENGDTIAVASVAQFVRQRIDIRSAPKKSLLRAMSDYCTDIEERKTLLHLCSKDGRKQYSEHILSKGLSVLDVLEQKAKSCRAPLSIFLDQLPSIAPRWYSATSSPELDGHNVLQFAFSVVENGLATNALARQCQDFLTGKTGPSVLLIPRESDSSSNFRPPASLETDYIMIGPGTGVAPFRGFLRERASQLKPETSKDIDVGRTMLFFGCRHAEKDFLYKDDLNDLQETGVLSELDVAISRAGPEKIYVQHRLEARGEEVAEIISNGGHVYVCGDGGGMAQGVHLALGKILGQFCCDGNEEEGKNMLRGLSTEHRYVKDIWFYGEIAE